MRSWRSGGRTRAEGTLAGSEAEIRAIESEERADLYRLAVLVGKHPEVVERISGRRSSNVDGSPTGTFPVRWALGFESLHASDLLSGPSRYSAIGPELRRRVFDAGRVHDEALAERARADAATASYHKIVFQALGEVETAPVAYQTQQMRREALRRAVVAACESFALAQRLYSKELQDFLQCSTSSGR